MEPTENTTVPAVNLAHVAFGAVLERDDGCLPVLVVREGGVVKVRFAGGGEDHDATLAGLRRLIDGIWLYQQAVAGMKYEAAHQARIQSGEIVIVDAEGIPDADAAAASEARIAELRGRGPSLSGAY